MKVNRGIQHILKQRLLNYKKRVVPLGRMGILIEDQHKQTKHMRLMFETLFYIRTLLEKKAP